MTDDRVRLTVSQSSNSAAASWCEALMLTQCATGVLRLGELALKRSGASGFSGLRYRPFSHYIASLPLPNSNPDRSPDATMLARPAAPCNVRRAS